jgi:hypothetical protein
LRLYQQQAVDGVFAAWREFDRVLGVAPTGSGKTIQFAHIGARRIHAGPVLILAHRDELLDQARTKIAQAVGLVAEKEKAQDWAKQIDILSRNQVDLNLVRDRGHASALTSALFAHLETVPATEKQKRYLRFLEHPNPWQLTKREAGRWIAQPAPTDHRKNV